MYDVFNACFDADVVCEAYDLSAGVGESDDYDASLDYGDSHHIKLNVDADKVGIVRDDGGDGADHGDVGHGVAHGFWRG